MPGAVIPTGWNTIHSPVLDSRSESDRHRCSPSARTPALPLELSCDCYCYPSTNTLSILTSRFLSDLTSLPRKLHRFFDFLASLFRPDFSTVSLSKKNRSAAILLLFCFLVFSLLTSSVSALNCLNCDCCCCCSSSSSPDSLPVWAAGKNSREDCCRCCCVQIHRTDGFFNTGKSCALSPPLLCILRRN